MQTKKTFHLYRLRHKKGLHDVFDTWFTSPRKAFGPMKAKYNKYPKNIKENYNPENYEAVEYLITETRTINVNND